MKHSNTTHIHKSLSDQRAWAESHSMGFLNKSLGTDAQSPFTYSQPHRKYYRDAKRGYETRVQVVHSTLTNGNLKLQCVISVPPNGFPVFVFDWLIRRSSIGSTDGVGLVDGESLKPIMAQKVHNEDLSYFPLCCSSHISFTLLHTPCQVTFMCECESPS